MKTQTFGEYVLQENEDGSTTGFAKLSPIFTCDSMLPETNWQFAVIIVSALNATGITPETFKSARKINLPPLELAIPLAAVNTHYGRQVAENNRQEVINEKMGVTLTLREIEWLATHQSQADNNRYYSKEAAESNWRKHPFEVERVTELSYTGITYQLKSAFDTPANRQAIETRRKELQG